MGNKDRERFQSTGAIFRDGKLRTGEEKRSYLSGPSGNKKLLGFMKSHRVRAKYKGELKCPECGAEGQHFLARPGLSNKWSGFCYKCFHIWPMEPVEDKIEEEA